MLIPQLLAVHLLLHLRILSSAAISCQSFFSLGSTYANLSNTKHTAELDKLDSQNVGPRLLHFLRWCSSISTIDILDWKDVISATQSPPFLPVQVCEYMQRVLGKLIKGHV